MRLDILPGPRRFRVASAHAARTLTPATDCLQFRLAAQVATIGLDIAKSVFQMHGVDIERGVVIRQKLTRARLLKFFESYPPVWSGSSFAEGNITSDHAYRTNRLHTWPHQPGSAERQINPC
jgi:hypothetical protein